MEQTCIDLRPWAKANRYRWRYEEGHTSIEPDAHWFVEVLCHCGLIYPKGNDVLLAYATRGVKRYIAKIEGAAHHQSDGTSEVFRFPGERLDDVAAILKPKKFGGNPNPSPAQLANLQEGRRRLAKRRLEIQGTGL